MIPVTVLVDEQPTVELTVTEQTIEIILGSYLPVDHKAHSVPAADATGVLKDIVLAPGTVLGRRTNGDPVEAIDSTELFENIVPVTLISTAAGMVPLTLRAAAGQTAAMLNIFNASGQVLTQILPQSILTVATLSLGSTNSVPAGVRAIFHSGAVGTIPVVARAVAGQTADLLQWQDNAGAVLSRVAANGEITVGGTISPGSLTAIATAIDRISLVARAMTGQTGDLQQWHLSAGGIVARMTTAGQFTARAIVADTPTASVIPLIAKGASLQSANLQEWQGDGGGVKAAVGPDGYAWFGSTTTPGGMIGVTPFSATSKGIVVKGLAAQTGALQEWQNSVGTIVAQVTPSGDVIGQRFGAAAVLNSYLGGVSTSGVTLTIHSGAVDRVPLVTRAATSQTADLQQWQGPGGASIARVDAAGGFYSTQLIVAGVGTALNAMGTDTPVAVTTLTLEPGSAARHALVLRGKAAQTGRLLEWRTSADTVLGRIGPDGHVHIGGLPAFTAALFVQTFAVDQPAQATRAIASQTSNLSEWQTSAGALRASVDVNGNVWSHRQFHGGFGGVTTTVHPDVVGGVLDWNDPTNARSGNGYNLLHGTTALNGPGVASSYFHSFSWEYSTKDGTGNMTQLAVPYSHDRGFLYRYRHSGAWSTWMRLVSERLDGRVGIGDVTPIGKLHVFSADAAEVGQVTQVANGQTANIAEWRLGSNTIGRFDAAGQFLAVRGGYFAVTSTSAVTLRSRATAGQTAGLQEWQDSAGVMLVEVEAAGRVISERTARFRNLLPDNSVATVNIRAATGQTSDLQWWTNTTGATLLGVDINGAIIPGAVGPGIRIGTLATHKVGFFNAAPVVQPSGTPADATDMASAIALVNDLKAKLMSLGLVA